MLLRANNELVAGDSTDDIVATFAYSDESMDRDDVRDDKEIGKMGVLGEEEKCGAKFDAASREGSSVDEGEDGGKTVVAGPPATTPGTRKLESGGW